jgi:hypothetical protein
MPYFRQISLTGRPASASLRIDTIWVSVNFDWRRGTSWLRRLFCQKVLLFDRLSLGEAYDRADGHGHSLPGRAPGRRTGQVEHDAAHRTFHPDRQLEQPLP